MQSSFPELTPISDNLLERVRKEMPALYNDDILYCGLTDPDMGMLTIILGATAYEGLFDEEWGGNFLRGANAAAASHNEDWQAEDKSWVKQGQMANLIVDGLRAGSVADITQAGIIGYLSAYILRRHITCLQSQRFSDVDTSTIQALADEILQSQVEQLEGEEFTQLLQRRGAITSALALSLRMISSEFGKEQGGKERWRRELD